MHRYIFSLLLSLGVSAANAQESTFSLSEIEEEDAQIPTVASVNELEKKATAQFEKGNCEAAIPLLTDYREKANLIAGVISQGLEPFYGASYDDRDSFGGNISELASYEGRANTYLRKRNRAFVMTAECKIKLGNRAGATQDFYQALDLIDLDNSALWKRARTGLYQIIEYSE